MNILKNNGTGNGRNIKLYPNQSRLFTKLTFGFKKVGLTSKFY